MPGVLCTRPFDLHGPRRKRIAKRAVQATKEPDQGLVCLGMPKHGSPKGLPVFPRCGRERFPNTYTLHSYCAFLKERMILSKVKLRHTGRKVKFDTPNSVCQIDPICGYLIFGDKA